MLKTSLISYWKLDGNSLDAFASNNGTDANITYNAGNGKIIQGAGCNGTSSSIEIADSIYGIGSGFSICAWIKTSASGADQSILSRDLPAVNPRCWQFKVAQTTGKLTFLRFNSSNSVIETISSSAAVNTGSFVHVAATFDTTNGTVLYINGASDGTSADTTALNNSSGTKPVIGADHTTGNPLTFADFLNGAIDEVGFWSRKLSSSEISQIYNGGNGLSYDVWDLPSGAAFLNNFL